MTSPIRAFFNWLALASVVGLLLWREHSWQLRARQAEAAPAVVGGGGAEESELLATNGVLQRRASEAEARAGALGAELEALKRAVEAAKPAPGPADLAKQFAAQRGLAFKPAPVWTPAPMEAILDKVGAAGARGGGRHALRSLSPPRALRDAASPSLPRSPLLTPTHIPSLPPLYSSLPLSPILTPSHPFSPPLISPFFPTLPFFSTTPPLFSTPLPFFSTQASFLSHSLPNSLH